MNVTSILNKTRLLYKEIESSKVSILSSILIIECIIAFYLTTHVVQYFTGKIKHNRRKDGHIRARSTWTQ